MTTNGNPFLNFDPSKFMGQFDPAKMMAQFDPSKMADEFTKMTGDFNIPGVDLAALADSQRKNLEALAQANKVALEGLQATATRQAEIFADAMNTAVSGVEKLGKGAPQDQVAEQIEAIKGSFEQALANMGEMSTMMGKTSQDASTTIHKRISESLEEFKKIAAKAQTK